MNAAKLYPKWARHARWRFQFEVVGGLSAFALERKPRWKVPGRERTAWNDCYSQSEARGWSSRRGTEYHGCSYEGSAGVLGFWQLRELIQARGVSAVEISGKLFSNPGHANRANRKATNRSYLVTFLWQGTADSQRKR